MNAKQEAKLTMFQSVKNHCEDNSGIIAANVAFQTAFNTFKRTTTAINQTAQQIDRALTGITADFSPCAVRISTIKALKI